MIRISNKAIISAVAGNIYRMHPYHMPEGIDKIMEHLVSTLDKMDNEYGCVETGYKVFRWESFNHFEKWLDEVLRQVPEYHELNVSRERKDKRASKFVRVIKRLFGSREKIAHSKRYTDFIDLYALIQNVACDIDALQQMNEDCFLCKYAKEYGSTEPSECEKCNNCLANPKIKLNRETHPMALKPRNQWTEEEKKKYTIW